MKRIAFIIYDNMTLLDFAGVYDPVTRLRSQGFCPGLSYDVCARKDRIHSCEGVELIPDHVGNDLSGYDYVIVPGGNGVSEFMKDTEFLRWISVGSEKTTLVAVCGGSLLLGAAGLLKDKKAATHPQLMGFLQNFAGTVVPNRIVDEGSIITAGGVTAAIDLGLYLCEKIAGRGPREKIQRQMDYRNYCTV